MGYTSCTPAAFCSSVLATALNKLSRKCWLDERDMPNPGRHTTMTMLFGSLGSKMLTYSTHSGDHGRSPPSLGSPSVSTRRFYRRFSFAIVRFVCDVSSARSEITLPRRPSEKLQPGRPPACRLLRLRSPSFTPKPIRALFCPRPLSRPPCFQLRPPRCHFAAPPRCPGRLGHFACPSGEGHWTS